ncbi:kelch-like protein 25 [Arctopsyche grandis]|uniref:kelch-like protein 25 n=1 Tax=Arctopsyche grandis TaxID=121162 RepID=UPI00406D6F44
MYRFLTIFITTFAVVDSTKFHCTTPENKPGLCILDDDCPPAASIKKQNLGLEKDIEFIKSLYCGQIEDNIKVCCDSEELNTCPNINEPTLQITCHYRSLITKCSDPMVTQSVVYPTCIPEYELSSLNSLNPINCVNGTWDGQIPRCVFSCLAKWKCDAHVVVRTDRYPVNSKRVSDVSPFIRNIFNSTPETAFVKELENFRNETVQAVINFMNSLETSYWKVYQYPEIIEISQKLQSTKIYDTCVKLLESQTNESSYISILEKFSESNDSMLTNQVIMYIEDNFDTLSTQSLWVQLNETHISELISSDFLNATSERKVFEGLDKWTKHNFEKRKNTFGELLKYIRLDQLSDSYVMINISPECNRLTEEHTRLCNKLNSNQESKQNGVKTPSRGVQKDDDLAILVVSVESFHAKIEAYDVETNTWSHITSTGLEYILFSSAVFNNELIIFGGVNNEQGFNKVLSIDLTTNKVTDFPNMLEKRAASKPVVVGDSLYVIGGVNFNKTQSTAFERYDSSSKTWSLKAPLPKSLVGFSAELWHESIYIIGGSNDGTYSKSIYIYNTITNRWSIGSESMTFARVHAGSAIVRGELYVIGGHNGTSVTPMVEKFNLKTRKWKRVADLPSPYETVYAVGHGFKIIVISGHKLFEYHTRTDLWKRLKGMDSTYFYRSMFSLPKKLIVP